MKSSKDKSFQNWKRAELLFSFGLQNQLKCDWLQDWLKQAETQTLSSFEETYLTLFQQKAALSINNWKEVELRDHFIAPIIALVDFTLPEYFLAGFSERSLEVSLKGIALKGRVDYMVAMGLDEPYQPFFFIHEYKKEQGSSNDPLAQLLAAMLAAQALNQEPFETEEFKPLIKHDPNMPVYGCYILGRHWHFVILQGKQYCVSESFDATKLERLRQIVRILKAQKQITVSKLRKVSEAII